MKNIDIILSLGCNFDCYFCNPQGPKESFSNMQRILNIIKWSYIKWLRSITFSWWEPTLDVSLLTYIKFADRLGFDRIKVQTNLSFSDSYYKRLVSSGMNVIWSTYFWCDENEFFKITWKQTGFDNYMNNIRKLGREIKIKSMMDFVLNKDIITDIPKRVQLLNNFWIEEFYFKFPFYTGKKRIDYDIWEYIEKIKDLFFVYPHINASILYAPTCYFQGLEDKIYDFSHDYIYDGTQVISLEDTIHKLYNKPDQCWSCKLYKRCFWFENGSKKSLLPQVYS